MEHVELMKIYKRVCKRYTGSCSKCILSSENNGTRSVCCAFMCDHPKEAEEILLKWNEEHPQKTRLEDFKKKYPNALIIDKTGIPAICTRELGYTQMCRINVDISNWSCRECWNQPIDE